MKSLNVVALAVAVVVAVALIYVIVTPYVGGTTLGSSAPVAEVTVPPGAYIAPSDWDGKRFVFDEKYYSPNTVTVKVGQAVRWTNKDSSPHTVTSHKVPNAAVSFDSKILEPSKQFVVTFKAAGEYEYHCQLHPFAAGKIVVKS